MAFIAPPSPFCSPNASLTRLRVAADCPITHICRIISTNCQALWSNLSRLDSCLGDDDELADVRALDEFDLRLLQLIEPEALVEQRPELPRGRVADDPRKGFGSRRRDPVHLEILVD